MPPSWRCAFALAAIRCGLAAAAADGPVPVATSESDAAALPREALLRRSDEEASAVVSSQGVRYVTPHHREKGVHKLAGVPKEPSLPVAVDDELLEASGRNDTFQRPNSLYFIIGIATFLVALGLMTLGMRKQNYLTEAEGEEVLQQDNPQAEDEPAPPVFSRRASLPPEHPGNLVPYRMQQVLVAWIFIVASVAFFMDYLAIQASFTKACHYFGMTAAFLWLLGFLIHFHWQVSVGTATNTQVAGSFFKVMACIMMQVHPFSMIIGKAETDSGVWWPAFTALALWHTGNLIGCYEFYRNPPHSSDRNAGLMAWGNLEVTEIFVDSMATFMLLFAAVSITKWNGAVENQLLSGDNPGVVFCEFGGAALFLLASCVKCEWCNGFRNCSHRGLGSQEADCRDAREVGGLIPGSSSSSSR